MSSVAVSFRIPSKVKKQATQVAKKLGVPLSLVVVNALKNFAITKKITITENGFTSEFEKEILQSAKVKTKPMTKKEFLESLT